METLTRKRRISAYIIPGLDISSRRNENNKTNLTSKRIKLLVAEYFGIESYKIDYKSRKRKIVKPRQLAHYFSKELTKESLETIGLAIGNQDHATVLYSCKTVNNLSDTDKQFKLMVNSVRNFIKLNA